jgi:hypothetical protein
VMTDEGASSAFVVRAFFDVENPKEAGLGT